MDPDVVLVSMDDDEPDFTADEIDDMWEFGGAGLDDDDYMVEGCVFPGECCMPGPHYRHECHTPAMIEDQHNDKVEPRRDSDVGSDALLATIRKHVEKIPCHDCRSVPCWYCELKRLVANAGHHARPEAKRKDVA